MSRLGIFGGTFDPPHLGHMIVAQDVYSALKLDRILFVPAGQPPHKTDRAVTAAEIRQEMIRAAVGGDGRFEVSDLEVRREGASYTVDTLRTLREFHARTEFFLVIGVDQLAELEGWREPEEVARLARLVVMARDGEDPSTVDPGVDVDFDTVSVTRVDVSSTLIRERTAAGRPVRYLVSDPVQRIIQREKLYLNG